MRKGVFHRKSRIEAYIKLLRKRRKKGFSEMRSKLQSVGPTWFKEMWEEFSAFSKFSF